MAEYTYKDVIIDPDDPRVEFGKGKEYYFGCLPRDVLEKANTNSSLIGELKEIRKGNDFPFVFMGFTDGRSCIIRKKEPEKKYVPFDLSNEEDRAKLRGAWVREKDGERELYVTAIYMDEKPPFVVLNDNGYNAEEFLEGFTFLDGTPCGKLVEQMASK